MEKMYLKNWNLLYKDKVIPASVPGDITIDFYKANLIDNPYYALNYQKCAWIGRTDFTYQYHLEISKEQLESESINLIFKGIDLFSEIFANGVSLGSTKNMFLLYAFELKEHLHVGHNVIEVKMKSTLNAADKIDTTGYYSIFNEPRIFLRKTQCHFGWDWAPKICGYGIWDDAYIVFGSKYRIDNVQVVSDLDGSVSMFARLNYNIRKMVHADGTVAKEAVPFENDTLRYSVSSKPNGNEYVSKEVTVNGNKNICGIKINDPKLWWPIGYGDHPLYNYKVELIRDGKVIDVKEGKFAFRKVELKENATYLADTLGFKFYINNQPIFIKGSNWVPIECFTGVVEDQKYKDLISLAHDNNFNMLRVWGGGMYEKDIFYDTCDEQGMLVWQDMCFACADIPEEDKDFVDNSIKEIEYQIERLRNHPSIIYWCGGNEKTGCYGLAVTHGDFFVNNLLYGVIMNLDNTRPYKRQSPVSHTDVGNDKTSGESHHNVFEMSLVDGMNTYRKSLNKQIVPFVSECAVMGPCSLQGMKKIFPKENLWPMDYMWKDRFMENPYGSVPMDFPHREAEYAKQLYGEPKDLEDFIPKGMMAHAEALRAEIEFARAHKGINSGILNWMYTDIWPSGTWSIVDYWLEPKQAFYQMKRSFKSIYVSFFEGKDEKTKLFAVNDTLLTVNLGVHVYCKTYDGKVVFDQEVTIEGLDNECSEVVELNFQPKPNTYLTAEYKVVGQKQKTIYSPAFYSDSKCGDDFEWKLVNENKDSFDISVKANSFVKSLFINLEDNCKYLFSDNYLDLETGESATIHIVCKEGKPNISSLTLTSFKN